jgi:hypothetical protein
LSAILFTVRDAKESGKVRFLRLEPFPLSRLANSIGSEMPEPVNNEQDAKIAKIIG